MAPWLTKAANVSKPCRTVGYRATDIEAKFRSADGHAAIQQ